MNALTEILSSRVKAEVFRLLFGLNNQPLHLHEMKRQSGLAVGTVRQELEKLTGLGLIEKRVDGNRRLFSANRNHPLYPDIHGLVLKTSGLAELLREVLMPELRVSVAFVFGSVARNEQRAQSDIDLLIIGSISLRKLTPRLREAAERCGREINPHVFLPEEFARRRREGDHFIGTVMADSRIFIIGSDHELEAMGG